MQPRASRFRNGRVPTMPNWQRSVRRGRFRVKELRDFAERVLFARLEESSNARRTRNSTDERHGSPMCRTGRPGRPVALRFSRQGAGKANFRLHPAGTGTRTRALLHFFANRELLATELMALVPLRISPMRRRRFAVACGRRSKDEQATKPAALMRTRWQPRNGRAKSRSFCSQRLYHRYRRSRRAA